MTTPMPPVPAPVTAPAPCVVPTTPTIADRLLGAAAYGEEHGWCAGTERDAAGRVCVIGALRAVFGIPAGGWGSPEGSRACAIVDDAAKSMGVGFGPDGLRPAAHYSDTHTDAERAALLRKAAELAS